MLYTTMHNRVLRLVLAVLGELIAAAALNLFIVPLSLYTGGLMGLCQLIRTLLQTALGLELFAPQDFAWGITSVRLPAGVDGNEVVRLAAERHGVYMAGGQDHLKGRIVRIGHMGWVDWADVLAGLHALAASLQEAGGHSGSRDYLEQGLAAYHAALAVDPGTPLPLTHA